MNCNDARAWLNALSDGELDARNSADVQAHLNGCQSCMAEFKSLEALRVGLRRVNLRHEVPDSLLRKVTSNLGLPEAVGNDTALASVSGDQSGSGRKPSISRWLLFAGWPVAAAMSALLLMTTLQQRTDFSNEVVAMHVRSLLADHLSDVASSSHHTVKPWFAGKLDFAPPVPELSSQGFDLVGGRLEYLDHRTAAAIVYRRNGHIINLLVRLPTAHSAFLSRTSTPAGYSLREWHAAGLECIAISDMEPAELKAFERAFTTAVEPS